MSLIIPSTPQAFTFGSRNLSGRALSYTGKTARRAATHTFPKRDGASEEDMGRDQRSLEVSIVFTGDTCAKDYQEFEADVAKKPSQLLTHPIAGQWQAFCRGPQHRIDFSKAINQIEVTVLFTEDQLDANVPTDVLDVSTAKQNASTQQSSFQQSVAAFMGELAKFQTASAAVLNQIDDAVDQVVSVATAPVAFMTSVINVALGASSKIKGALASIQAANDALVTSVQSLIDATVDVFDGVNDTADPGSADSIATLVQAIQDDASTLEDALMAAQATPAGCADAFAEVEVMVDCALSLKEAIAASQPPTARMIVPRTMSLVAFAQKVIADLDLGYDAMTFASAILGLNRIPNPAQIPGGSTLIVPTA